MIIRVLLVSIAHHLVLNYCRWCFYETRNPEFVFLYYQHQSLQHTVYRQGHKVQAGYKYFLLHLGWHQVITLIKYLQRMLMVKSFSDYYYSIDIHMQLSYKILPTRFSTFPLFEWMVNIVVNSASSKSIVVIITRVHVLSTVSPIIDTMYILIYEKM